jgi:multidrug efflux pump subunit AcrA (membrane-fusion protein)
LPEGREGIVSKVAPSIDRTTRTFLVEVQVPNQDGQCKPGSFAKARIKVGVSEGSATIPISGLYSLAGINKIFIVDGNRAKELHVVVGEQSKDWVEIMSPALAPSWRVVTSGQRMLSEGTPIVEREQAQASSNQTDPR